MRNRAIYRSLTSIAAHMALAVSIATIVGVIFATSVLIGK